MQAWVYRHKGDPSKILSLETEYPRPIPSGDQILLKVSAVSLNVRTLSLSYSCSLSLSSLIWALKELIVRLRSTASRVEIDFPPSSQLDDENPWSTRVRRQWYDRRREPRRIGLESRGPSLWDQDGR